MINSKINPLCKEAELYYYDFINDQSRDLVPDFITEHINGCQNCREQINHLKAILSQVEGQNGFEQNQINLAAINWLKLHFAFIGKPVNCEIVKPFLPGLLDPALKIKISTPITVHIDNCEKCRQDLEIIRKLNLNSGQLYRLSRLFSEKRPENDTGCLRAQAAVLTVVSMIFGRTPEEVLNHLCICPNCRKVLYQYRDTLCKALLETQTERKNLACEEVSAKDIYDITIPYGLKPEDSQPSIINQALTFHIADCPECLGKMQHLHNTIFEIFERPDSGILTIYHIDEPAKTEASQADPEKGKLKAEKTSAVNFGTVLRQKILSKKIKPLYKIAAAAAVIVILISAGLFLSINSAKAIQFKDIYKNYAKAQNVHISNYMGCRKEPFSQDWISKTLNTYIRKNNKETILWDTKKKIKKIKIKDNNSVEVIKLSSDIIKNIQNMINSSPCLKPFLRTSEIPNAEWRSVSNAESANCAVYELAWTDKTENLSTIRKFRIYVDTKTNLPKRMENYQKSDCDEDYKFKITTFEYLSDIEMQKAVKEAFLN